MELSKYLTLEEAIYSNTAKKYGIDNNPTLALLEVMKYTATNVYDALYDHFKGNIRLNSFYRSPKLNTKIGGATKSQHTLGEAVDISGKNGVTNTQIFEWAKANLKFDQIITEFPDANGVPAWIHISIKKDSARKSILLAKKVKGKTVYIPFK